MLYCPYKRKTTAVAGSWRSLQPAQVITAPTQRTNPHRMGYYTTFSSFTQGGGLPFFPRACVASGRSSLLRCVGYALHSVFVFRPSPEGRKSLRENPGEKYRLGGKNVTKNRRVQICVLFVEPPRK